MANKKFLFTSILILLSTLLLAAGCANGSSANSSGDIKAGPGVDLKAKTITLGILSPYSGKAADPIGIPLANGVETYFKHVNDNGGIDGFKVKFLKEDTEYNPQIAVQRYNKIHNQVLMMADSLGTAPTFAIKDLAAADQMLITAGTRSSALAREKNLVMIGTPYRLEAENAFDYIVNKLGEKNPATGIIYQNDEYGQDGLTGYKEASTEYNLNSVAEGTYSPTDTDFTAQVSKMKEADAKYVFLTSTPSATAGILGAAAKLGYNPQWVLQSPAFARALLEVSTLVPLLSRAWIMGQGADWGDTSVPGMVQMQQDIQKYTPKQKPDGYFQFGYTASYVTHAILKKALGNKDITRAGLLKAFESLENVDLGGLLPPASYGLSPNERVPTRGSVVYAITPAAPAGIKSLTPNFTGTAAQKSQF
jgi:ABC-type branched-subunit amino acid transport system substrate-binding protein